MLKRDRRFRRKFRAINQRPLGLSVRQAAAFGQLPAIGRIETIARGFRLEDDNLTVFIFGLFVFNRLIIAAQSQVIDACTAQENRTVHGRSGKLDALI